LRTSRSALTTQEILRKVTNKCPNASISLLVALMDSGTIIGKWSSGKGYLWALPDLNNNSRLHENSGILPRK